VSEARFNYLARAVWACSSMTLGQVHHLLRRLDEIDRKP
jgi:hypothetical protein